MARPVCIVTGASRGIGRAIALRFAREKYDLVITGRDAAALERVAAEVRGSGVACQPLVLDAAQAAAGALLAAGAEQAFGRVDVLVNNAGIARTAAAPETSETDFRAMLDVLIGGVFHATRAVWPLMQRQRGGAIVNISSVAALDPFPTLGVYGACKAWVNTFTKAAAESGKPDNIRVFAVAPGAVDTEMLRGVAPDFPAAQALRPEDIAAVVWNVCQPDFAACTGQMVLAQK